ncbi:MAG: ATP-binding protein, partial [Longimicrobiales bacterium]
GKGSGLGLAMVYGIVRRAGGHVRVASTVGEGTTFSVYLPAAPDDSGMDATEGGGEQPTILLLQHDPAVRKAVRRILHRDGFSVLEADDPTEVAAFCREWPGPIHAVVSDTLDDEDEKLVRSALARHRPPTPTLWTWERETETPPAVGPSDGLLGKPFSTLELSRHLNEILGGSTDTEKRR